MFRVARLVLDHKEGDQERLLSHAPPSLLGAATDDNTRFEPLKTLTTQAAIEDSDMARRSRAILHAYAFRTFEAGNRALIGEIGWETESFIPPLETSDLAEGEELARIEELWRPQASAAELELLYLARALSRRRLRRFAGSAR